MTLTEGVADDDVATCLRFELSISNPTTSTPQRGELTYRLGTPRAIMINFVHFIESYENAQ